MQTDMHSHVLPGLDDGSPDIETSLELLRGIYDLGIRKTVATPHVFSDMYRNTPETINAALQILKIAVENSGIDIEISAAAEYMINDHFMKLLHDKQPLLCIYKNVILTEQSYATPCHNLHEVAFEILKAGYKPIMAHPERYGYYHNNYEQFNYMKDMGFYLQVNLLSLTGYYGKPVTKAAKYILENNLADFVGTDMHHMRHLNGLQYAEHLSLFKKYTRGNLLNGEI
jgi:tyrosine-protein phosphatase YwqE